MASDRTRKPRKRRKPAPPALTGRDSETQPSTAQGAALKDGSGYGNSTSAGGGGVDDPDDDSAATLLLRMQEEFTAGVTGNSKNLARADHDDLFLVGENHWDPTQLDDRIRNERPALVVNTVNLPYFQ